MLKGSHCRLHQIAGVLVRRSEFDPSTVKELEMGSNSEFTAAASALVLAIVTMKKRVEKKTETIAARAAASGQVPR
jgi:hypothetical protein